MHRLLNVILGATLLAASAAALPSVASAAPHARVTPLDCGALAAKVGRNNVWQASFAGMRHGIGHFKFFERTSAVGCFRTQSACVDWLYWEQSDWPYMNSAGRCRRGMPYGQ